MKKFFYCVLLLCAGMVYAAESESVVADTAQAEEARRLDTIRYGTEAEIAALIQTLKSETNADIGGVLDDALIAVTQNTRNQNILSGVLSFFGARGKQGLEERAVRAIEERDEEANATVIAALDYLGKVKAASAIPTLKAILDANEAHFTNSAIRALGRATSDGGAAGDDATKYLLDYYEYQNPTDESRREIVVAIGETGSKTALPVLINIVENDAERPTVRMAALDTLAKLKDDSALDAILSATSASDTNVRASAIAALGPFSGVQVEDAILEGFRDSYYRTRIGAAKAAGERKLAGAVPYLRFRAERDDVATVKEEAIRALGAIGNSEAMGVLSDFFLNRKMAERTRLLSAEMLIKNDADAYVEQLITELEEANKSHYTSLYNGFLRVLGMVKTPKVEEITRRFLSSGGVLEKSYALDIAVNNSFTSLVEPIRAVASDTKNSGLSRKAKTTLTKLGLE
ncbi:MAG: HEAT repeat domain-containing protein [Treponema sp.]|nr:HEAT repeat domain-containing protein [Treponema sp.]